MPITRKVMAAMLTKRRFFFGFLVTVTILAKNPLVCGLEMITLYEIVLLGLEVLHDGLWLELFPRDMNIYR